MASIKLKGDTSGEVTISAPAVAGTNTLTLPAKTGTLATQNSLGVRNLIINGDMRIDQRNAGASVTIVSTGASQYTVDRFFGVSNVVSKFTVQQNAGAVTPPEGFTNYLGATSSSAYSISVGDYFAVGQHIEGFNIADLGWGTANAKTVTLSFWVYSSLTGTFGGGLRNFGANRSYPFSYTIETANTWTQISVTIAGSTTGTWVTNNGIGIQLWFGLGVGSTYSGTAGSWATGNYVSATGATSVVGTSGATLYITGVQLEVGTEATPFEHRPYDMELARCKRYFRIGSFGADWESGIYGAGSFQYSMRSAPTVSNVTYDLILNIDVSKGVNGMQFFLNDSGKFVEDYMGWQMLGLSPTRSYGWGYFYLNAEL